VNAQPATGGPLWIITVEHEEANTRATLAIGRLQLHDAQQAQMERERQDREQERLVALDRERQVEYNRQRDAQRMREQARLAAEQRVGLPLEVDDAQARDPGSAPPAYPVNEPIDVDDIEVIGAGDGVVPVPGPVGVSFLFGLSSELTSGTCSSAMPVSVPRRSAFGMATRPASPVRGRRSSARWRLTGRRRRTRRPSPRERDGRRILPMVRRAPTGARSRARRPTLVPRTDVAALRPWTVDIRRSPGTVPDAMRGLVVDVWSWTSRSTG
jgi:hypothetical protein